MLVEHQVINPQDFLLEFSKRFSNFCQKAPIDISYKTTLNDVKVIDHSKGDVTTFTFDFTKPVKDNIRQIKEVLCETKYPLLIEQEVKERDYTPEEVQKMIDHGADPEKVLTAKKRDVIKEVKWRIERVIVRRDEFFIRDLTTNELFRFKFTKMPSTLFLKRYRERMNPYKAWEVFKERSILIGKVEEVANI